MARIAYGMCNVVTGDDSTSYRRSDNSEPAPQVTMPHLRARVTIHEAKALAEDLAHAAGEIKLEEVRTKPVDGKVIASA